MAVLGLLRRVADRFPLGRRTWRIIQTVEEADLVPDRLPRAGAILVADAAGPKWLAFDCPCTQRHRIMLNLSQHRRPTWRVGRPDPLDLRPSVDSGSAAGRCHYWIRGGRVHWVQDSGGRQRDH